MLQNKADPTIRLKIMKRKFPTMITMPEKAEQRNSAVPLSAISHAISLCRLNREIGILTKTTLKMKTTSLFFTAEVRQAKKYGLPIFIFFLTNRQKIPITFSWLTPTVPKRLKKKYRQ